MSDITPDGPAPVDPTPAPKKAPAPRKPMTVAQVAKAIAAKKGTDQGVEAKKLRGYIRANFDTVAKQWPGLQKAKDNRDGNRYPPMPAKLGRELIARRTK